MSSSTLQWIDTHCHVHDDKMSKSPGDSLSDARNNGVGAFIVIGTDAQTSAAAVSLASAHDDVWATVGLHPHDAVLGVDSITPFIHSPKVVAIGECGLDYYYEHSPRETQLPVFAEQIALAKDNDLTLVIHTRDAWDDTYAVLDEVGMPNNTIIHCFTGGPEEARQCLDRGAFLSFSGIVTFKNAVEIQEAAKLCPLDRLLVETDSPFLAPVPHRGRPNEPAHVAIVGTAIADLRGLPVSEVANATTANALRAFPRLVSVVQ
jgi:TatD DNase family protein